MLRSRFPSGASRPRPGSSLSLLLSLTALALLLSCTVSYDEPDLTGKDIRLTILHTSDIHSRLLPYDLDPNYTDQVLGLKAENGPFGGISRLATLIKRERAKADRLIHVDSGDCFQGAPIFNLFHGEVEMRSMSELHPTAVVVGNHEFDQGAQNYANQLSDWSGFPSLAANYLFQDPSEEWANQLARLIQPYTIVNANGLKIGIIGMGNQSSMNSLPQAGNSLGITPLDNLETARIYVAQLRPMVDFLMIVSHLGLTEDEDIARQVSGIDLIAGGHLHVAINPPKTIRNEATGYETIIMHSGAFNKYLGRLDVVIRDKKVLSHSYQLFPVDKTLQNDPDMDFLMEPYKNELALTYDLNRVVGHASTDIKRFGTTGGDGALGNLVAEAMQLRNRVETDFSLTNTLGIRTDIQAGDITLEELYNVLPFENSITTMFLSGTEIQELFDFVAYRSSDRGCNAQAQISGATFTMDCLNRVARDITIGGSGQACRTEDDCADATESCVPVTAGSELGGRCFRPLNPNGVYELATNDYIASGGSGFIVLQQNTTQFNTGISIRSAVIDYLLRYPEIPDYTSDVAVEDGRIRVTYGE